MAPNTLTDYTFLSSYPSQPDSLHRLSEDLAALMRQLFPTDQRQHDALALRRSQLDGGDVHTLLALADGHVVGTATLAINRLPSGTQGLIADVVVEQNYRGQKIGRHMIKMLIDTARKRGVEWVELTSASHREDAHEFYKLLGFKQNGTQYFSLDL